MIFDERTEFCDATALNTGAAGTYNIGDVIDSQVGSLNTLINHGEGQQLYLVISVDTTATSGGSATAQFRIVSDAVATPDTSTATVHYTSSAIPVASLTAGSTPVVVALPQGNYERYIGIQQITGTAAFTAGKVNAFMTLNPASFKAYADNVA